MINSLLQKIKRNGGLVSNTFHLFVNKGLNAIVPFLLIPLYTKIFGIAQFGELVYVQSICTLLMFVTDYGFNVTGARDIAAHESDEVKTNRIVSSILIIKVFLVCTIGLGIGLASQLLTWKTETFYLYLFTFCSFAFQSLTPYWFFQGKKKNYFITIVNLFSKLVLVILILFFIINQTVPLYVVSLIEFFSYLLSFIIAVILVALIFKIKIRFPAPEEITNQLKSGKDIFIITLLNWSIVGGAMIVVEWFCTKEELGYFGTFSRVTYYAFAALQPINHALFPYVAQRFSQSGLEGSRFVAKLLKLFGGALIIFFLIAVVGAKPFFYFLFDKEFLKGLPVYINSFYLLLAWVTVVLLNNFLALQGLVAKGKDTVYRKLYLVNAGVAVLLLLIFVPLWKLEGAAIALLSGELVFLILIIKRSTSVEIEG